MKAMKYVFPQNNRLGFFYFFIVILISATFIVDAVSHPTFAEFVTKYNKTYDSIQMAIRKNLYTKNLNQITTRNLAWQGVTQFADWSDDQMTSYRKTLPSVLNNQLGSNSFTTNNDSTSITQFDWRTVNAFTSIKNQGICGSSWAFSTTAFFEQQNLKSSTLSTTASSIISFSSQFLISCSRKSMGCNGGYIDESMDTIINRGGVPLQTKYSLNPFYQRYIDICYTSDIYTLPASSRLSFFNIGDSTTLKNILLKKPVTIGVCAKDFTNYAPHSASSPGRTMVCSSTNTVIDHTVLLVGYTATEWIVKNSWGSDWGVQGYAYISNNAGENCCVGKELHMTGLLTTTGCSVSNCRTCVETNTCVKCNNGKWISIDGTTKVQTCETCSIANCQQCNDYIGTCKTCANTFTYYVDTTQCKTTTTANCLTISGGVCTSCSTGYKLSTEKMTCVSNTCLVIGCLDCTSGPSFCNTCQGGKSFNFWLRRCQAFVPTLRCSYHAFSTCFKCQSGYLYDAILSQCVQTCTASNCASCNPSNLATCLTCQPGYSLSGGSCSAYPCPLTGCLSCDSTGQICLKCSTPFLIFDSTSKTCISSCSLANCATCLPTDTMCKVCSAGFVVDYDSGICKASTVTNCIIARVYDHKLVCQACTAGYMIDVETWKCRKNCQDQFCQHCSGTNNSVCADCVGGYSKQVTGHSAVATCQPIPSLLPHCMLVSSDQMTCFQCDKYYTFNAVSMQCQLYTTGCDANCKACPEPGSYAQGCLCKDGYSFNIFSKVCQTNPIGANCLQFGAYGVSPQCFKCAKGYLLAGSFRQCVSACVVANCSECYQGSNGFCQKCTNGFYRGGNWNCIQCPMANCDLCHDSITCNQCALGFSIDATKMICQPILCTANQVFSQNQCVCALGYYLSGSTCALCTQKNCATCNVGSCLTCLDGYLIQSGSCSSCVENCKICTTTTSCSACIKGFFYESSSLSCIQTGYPILSYTIINNTASLCSVGCVSCSSSSACTSCGPSFTLRTTYCVPCESNCNTCYPNIPSSCLSCLNGFSLQQNACFKCTNAYCLMCQASVGICTNCAMGYYLRDKDCTACPMNCMTCGDNGCIMCNAGFALLADMTCQQCVGGCKSCNANSLTQCFSTCADSYVLLNSTCTKCPDNCLTCFSSSVCTTCMSSYLLKNNICTPYCSTGCHICSLSSPMNCSQCFKGYTLSSTTSTCIADVSCNANSSCSVCPFNYILSSSTCTQCNSPDKNCIQCSSIDIKKCTKCSQGYFVQNSMCSSCTSNCKYCSQSSVCQTCQDGFYLNILGVQTVGSCLACDAMCSTCKQMPTNCVTCPDNYELTANNFCVRKTRIQLTLILNMAFSDYVINAKQLTTALLNLLGSSYMNQSRYLIIKSVIAGSVNLTAQLAIPNGLDSATQLNSIQTQLLNSATLGNISIISVANVVLIGDSSSNIAGSSQSLKEAIIVFIVVIPLIVIGILIYCIIKRNNKVAEQGSQGEGEVIIQNPSIFTEYAVNDNIPIKKQTKTPDPLVNPNQLSMQNLNFQKRPNKLAPLTKSKKISKVQEQPHRYQL